MFLLFSECIGEASSSDEVDAAYTVICCFRDGCGANEAHESSCVASSRRSAGARLWVSDEHLIVPVGSVEMDEELMAIYEDN